MKNFLKLVDEQNPVVSVDVTMQIHLRDLVELGKGNAGCYVEIEGVKYFLAATKEQAKAEAEAAETEQPAQPPTPEDIDLKIGHIEGRSSHPPTKQSTDYMGHSFVYGNGDDCNCTHCGIAFIDWNENKAACMEKPRPERRLYGGKKSKQATYEDAAMKRLRAGALSQKQFALILEQEFDESTTNASKYASMTFKWLKEHNEVLEFYTDGGTTVAQYRNGKGHPVYPDENEQPKADPAKKTLQEKAEELNNQRSSNNIEVKVEK